MTIGSIGLRSRTLLCTAAFVVLVLSPYARRDTSAQSSGLVAAYSFDEGGGSVLTDSARDHDGTIAGAVWTGSGKFGGALAFDGVNDWVTIPDAADLDLTTAMTLEAWVYPSATLATWATVIMKEGSGTAAYNLYANDSGRPSVHVTVNNVEVAANGISSVPLNTWTHIAGTYDGANLRFYVNGNLVRTVAQTGPVKTSTLPFRIGGNAVWSNEFFAGRIDEVRVYNQVLSQADIQRDMAAPIGSGSGSPQQPLVITNVQTSSVTATSARVTWTTDEPATSAVEYGSTSSYNLQTPEDGNLAFSHAVTLTGLSPGATIHFRVRSRDGANNTAYSDDAVLHTLANGSGGAFLNEILYTDFTLPTNITWMPGGRLLVLEKGGTVLVIQPGASSPDPAPFMQVDVGTDAEQGLQTLELDPDFTRNGYVYVFYTHRSSSRDRLSRFTVSGNTAIPSSEVVIWQDSVNANADHHGGAIVFGNDGKLYLSIGDHANATDAQSLRSYHGKILRLNIDGTIPADNPFHDGNGPNLDAIWALGLRNPFRMTNDEPTGRIIISDVGGNVWTTAVEEINLLSRGANYGWPTCEGSCAQSSFMDPIYSYDHYHNSVARDASVTGGVVYRGTRFPIEYQSNYFFADYAQNWIKRITFDLSGNVSGVLDFEPLDGSVDGPYGDIVSLKEGPDGALYYVDIGFNDVTKELGTSKIRRIRYVSDNLPPVVSVAANPMSGTTTPFTANFSSAGSYDPDGGDVTFLWQFGDGFTSTEANPGHTYIETGEYTVRLTVSDGTDSAISDPITISIGRAPVVTIASPVDGRFFKAGDAISLSADATDDSPLSDSAFVWSVEFLHGSHTHPGLTHTGRTGTFVIPSSGHSFNGETRYQVKLTVTDSDGLQTVRIVTIYPQKVNLTFNSAPQGQTLTVDGLPFVTPFVLDTLINFNHVINAPDGAQGSSQYRFQSWSDSGAQQHSITVPSADRSYVATYTVTQNTSLVAAYSFDAGTGSVLTDSARDHHGTIAGAVWAGGKYGGALSFDGVNDWVTIADANDLDLTSAMTVEAWVYPTKAMPTWSTVLMKEGSGTQAYNVYANENGRPDVQVTINNVEKAASGVATLALNTWTHLAGTYDGTSLKLYVNGTLVRTVATTGAVKTSTLPLRIGGNASWSNEFFPGLIDEVRIYNRALSATEIQNDLATPIGGTAGPAPPPSTPPQTGPTPIAAYAFNEGGGTVLMDAARDHDGTVAGASWTASGKFGGALAFDGVNDWVTIPDANDLDLTAGMTLEAWVYPTATMRTWATVLMKEGTGAAAYTLYANDNGRPSVQITVNNVETPAIGVSAVPLNTWTHIAGTYDGTNLRFYVNGNLVRTVVTTGAIKTSTLPLRIGGNNVWPNEFFTGRIDEMRLYNQALTVEQIRADMAAPVAP